MLPIANIFGGLLSSVIHQSIAEDDIPAHLGLGLGAYLLQSYAMYRATPGAPIDLNWIISQFYAIVDLGSATGFGDVVPNSGLAKILYVPTYYLAANMLQCFRDAGKIFLDRYTYGLIKSFYGVESSFYEITDPEYYYYYYYKENLENQEKPYYYY